MSTLAEVMIPAGTVAPIVDEGYRYLPLDAPIVLQAGHTYVLAAWYATGGITTADIDNFYLLGTTETDIPSAVTIHPGIDVYASCMNPNAGDGSTCDPPFVFGMPWPMYAGGPNMRLQGTTATEDTSWGRVKSLY
ncbi:MAG: hypothetical protein JW819_01225 [Candidatus Krumholzibacteriota bacterium]|nr:hypothetical protein [Candidatus Krumholzibacteriota bacterium]